MVSVILLGAVPLACRLGALHKDFLKDCVGDKAETATPGVLLYIPLVLILDLAFLLAGPFPPFVLWSPQERCSHYGKCLPSLGIALALDSKVGTGWQPGSSLPPAVLRSDLLCVAIHGILI